MPTTAPPSPPILHKPSPPACASQRSAAAGPLNSTPRAAPGGRGCRPWARVRRFGCEGTRRPSHCTRASACGSPSCTRPGRSRRLPAVASTTGRRLWPRFQRLGSAPPHWTRHDPRRHPRSRPCRRRVHGHHPPLSRRPCRLPRLRPRLRRPRLRRLRPHPLRHPHRRHLCSRRCCLRRRRPRHRPAASHHRSRSGWVANPLMHPWPHSSVGCTASQQAWRSFLTLTRRAAGRSAWRNTFSSTLCSQTSLGGGALRATSPRVRRGRKRGSA